MCYCVWRWVIKNVEEGRVEPDDKGAQKAAALGRMIRVLVAYEARKKEAAEVEEEEFDEGAVEVEMAIEDMQKDKAIWFSSKQLAAYTRNYSTKLGSGGLGEVYKGDYTNGVELAIKVLNRNNSRSHRVDQGQFMAEVSTIGRTYHRNLVRLYGFCHEAKVKALVYEYMANGSLDRLLFSQQHRIEWNKLYDIAVGAAKGLEYLHHHCPRRIIHNDTKPANVLLDSNFRPKLADFGLAKLYDTDITHVNLSRHGGTPGYAAPEVWMPFPVTYKCDVYSFGMTLFEIIGCRRNLDPSLNQSQEWFPKRVWEKFDKGELEGMMRDSGIEEKDMEKARKLSMVALWCVQYLPEARPSMISVVKILEDVAEVATPPNPFQHLAPSSPTLPIYIESSTISIIEKPNIQVVTV